MNHWEPQRLWQTPRNEGFDAGKHNGKADSLHSQAKEPKLWPTPRANENDQGPLNRERVMESGMAWAGQGRGMTLTTAAKLWPTPTAQEAKHGAPSPGETVRKNGTIISAIGKLWPTPTERDWKSTSHGNQDNSRPLSEVAGLSGSGSLNPRFVEELMGFPIDHTACERSATPSVRSKRSPFSRRLPKLKTVDENP